MSENQKQGAKFYRSEILRVMNSKPTRENVRYWFGLDIDMRKVESLQIVWEKSLELEAAREAEKAHLLEEIERKNEQIAALEAELASKPAPLEPVSDVEKIASAVLLLPEEIAISTLSIVFDQATDIKTLYRQLARFLHPDVATDKAKSQNLFNHLKDIYDDKVEQRGNHQSRSSGFVSEERLEKYANEVPF